MKVNRPALRLALLLTGISCTGTLSAQTENTPGTETPDITLSDPRIDVLTDRYNKTYQLQGYRIQIISSSRKEEAKKAKSRFVAMFQEYTAYEIYQQPFFIIKVGDFLTKLEAERVHRMIKEEFQESYIIPDVITPYEQYTKE